MVPWFVVRISMVSTLKNVTLLLTLIREFLGLSPSAFFGKKSRIIAGDVTVWTLRYKNYMFK